MKKGPEAPFLILYHLSINQTNEKSSTLRLSRNIFFLEMIINFSNGLDF